MVSRVNIVGYDCGVEYDPDGYYVRYSDYAALEAENERLRKVLSNLLAPFADDECWKDHHGYCQAHFLEEDCCVAAARRALEGGE